MWGADRFVVGAAATARNLGISPILIGLTIVGFATSAPEILVAATASLKGSTMLAVGNAIGSNIANIAMVLGAVAVMHPVEVKSQTLMREMPVLLAVTLLTVSLFLDDYLSRIDGAVLIGTMGVVMYWIVRLAKTSSHDDPIDVAFEADIPADMQMRVSVLWLAVGFVTLLVGAELLVRGAHRHCAPIRRQRAGYWGHLGSDRDEPARISRLHHQRTARRVWVGRRQRDRLQYFQPRRGDWRCWFDSPARDGSGRC